MNDKRFVCCGSYPITCGVSLVSEPYIRKPDIIPEGEDKAVSLYCDKCESTKMVVVDLELIKVCGESGAIYVRSKAICPSCNHIINDFSGYISDA